jgi:SAM-dependent methyltransferase
LGRPTTPTPRPDYGIDAPPVIRNLLLIGGAAAAVAALSHFLDFEHPAGVPLLEISFITAVNCLLIAAAMVWYSKAGKLRGRERVLDRIPWRGDEAVLDVGCGRGLFLVGAARRLTTGRAVGVDLWQSEDLSGNRPEAAVENARREGVADRVDVRDGDARQLPFADASFDVVVSSMALHNIYDRPGRECAVREIARVLKPGGRVLIVDIKHTGEYVSVLRDSGVGDVKRSITWVSLLAMVVTWGGVRPFRVLASKPALPATR